LGRGHLNIQGNYFINGVPLSGTNATLGGPFLPLRGGTLTPVTYDPDTGLGLTLNTSAGNAIEIHSSGDAWGGLYLTNNADYGVCLSIQNSRGSGLACTAWGNADLGAQFLSAISTVVPVIIGNYSDAGDILHLQGGNAAFNLATRVRVTTAGTVILGSPTGTAVTSIGSLNVQTGIYLNGVAYAAPSDPDLKTDMTNRAPGALAQVNNVPVISYRWRDGRDDKHHIGFDATDVQRVLGEDIGCTVLGSRNYSIPEVVAVLWQAVQELSAEVETLKRRKTVH